MPTNVNIPTGIQKALPYITAIQPAIESKWGIPGLYSDVYGKFDPAVLKKTLLNTLATSPYFEKALEVTEQKIPNLRNILQTLVKNPGIRAKAIFGNTDLEPFYLAVENKLNREEILKNKAVLLKQLSSVNALFNNFYTLENIRSNALSEYAKALNKFSPYYTGNTKEFHNKIMNYLQSKGVPGLEIINKDAYTLLKEKDLKGGLPHVIGNINRAKLKEINRDLEQKYLASTSRIEQMTELLRQLGEFNLKIQQIDYEEQKPKGSRINLATISRNLKELKNEKTSTLNNIKRALFAPFGFTQGNSTHVQDVETRALSNYLSNKIGELNQAHRAQVLSSQDELFPIKEYTDDIRKNTLGMLSKNNVYDKSTNNINILDSQKDIFEKESTLELIYLIKKKINNKINEKVSSLLEKCIANKFNKKANINFFFEDPKNKFKDIIEGKIITKRNLDEKGGIQNYIENKRKEKKEKIDKKLKYNKEGKEKEQVNNSILNYIFNLEKE